MSDEKKQSWRERLHNEFAPCSRCGSKSESNNSCDNCPIDGPMLLEDDQLKQVENFCAAEISNAEARARALVHEENSLMVRQRGVCLKETCDDCRMCDRFYAALKDDLRTVRAEEAAKYTKVVEATHELLYAVYTFFDPEAADEIWDKRVRKCAEDAKAILKALEGK